jgi:hypothetical protein
MNPERKEKLFEIGFEFSVRDKAEKETWNLQFKKLQYYHGKHGHCELFWAVDRFTFILNTSTNTPPSSLLVFQVKCRTVTALTYNWALGSIGSVLSSKVATWIRNERGGSTRLVLNSLSSSRRTRESGICSLRSSRIIMENMATVSCFGLSTVLPSSWIPPLKLHIYLSLHCRQRAK